MSSFRGAAKRVWRRLQAVRRRKKAVADCLVVMVMVQVLVLVCVVSPKHRHHHQENLDTHTEVARRVGHYVVLFSTSTFTPATIPTSLPHSALATPHQEATREERSDDQRGRTDEDRTSGGRYSIQERRLNQKTWTPLEPVVPSSGRYFKWKSRRNEGLYKEKEKEEEEQEVEEGEEEDPDLGRGFQVEFVTYRSDDDNLLWVEETRLTAAPSHETNGEKPSKISNYGYGSTSKTEKSSEPERYSGLATHGDKNDVNEIKAKSKNDNRNASQSKLENYKFKYYNASDPDTFVMADDTRQYFGDVGGRICFLTGTNLETTKADSRNGCRCLPGYFGVDCGIPEAAWFSMYRNKFPDTRLSPRHIPRRIINGLPVNHEYAMFEARLHELHDLVDVFIVAESNYTAHGDAKDFNFLDKFRQGYLSQFQDKIVHVSLGYFPEMSRKNGWMADAYLRYHLGSKGLPLLKGLCDDDMFVLSDADELPTREILTFLKVYDGYPEPVSFALRWNVFGFFWQEPVNDSWWNWMKGAREAVSVVSSAATVAMLRDVLFNNAFYIRKTGLWQYYQLAKKLREYRDRGHYVKEWTAGTAGHYAGWHCSWCFSPENLIRKMDSAQANDVPRWGSFPHKRNLTYIASRIRKGIWFDDTKRFLPVRDLAGPYYAPRYLLRHPELYRSILFHPDHYLNLQRPWMPA